MRYVLWKKNEVVKFLVSQGIEFAVVSDGINFWKKDYDVVREFMDYHKELGIPVFTNLPIGKVLISRV